MKVDKKRYLRKAKAFLAPTRKINKSRWKKNWDKREKARFRYISRWFFVTAAVAYVLHFLLIDLPIGKKPVELWAAYRLGLAALSIAGVALSFHEKFYKSNFFKAPVILGGILFSVLQARTMIWHPETPYFYAFIIPCLMTVMLRMNLLKSMIYLAYIHILQVPTFLQAGLETHLIVSASMLSFLKKNSFMLWRRGWSTFW